MADTQTTDPAQAAAEAAARAQAQVQAQSQTVQSKSASFVTQVAQKIAEADNILVALSKDPTVDEMAAAIGLTLFLDGLGKHATAIYSGLTPNALQFLKPGDTFEANTNSLRDFIIALNKEKADHLRYKLDGDYVKVYITPYKTTIDENDLEFSHGDYNVDLVVALNVPTANDLDAALTEHGRIMHDASAVDITTGEPGKFGEIEWSDTGASSVAEMVTQLVLKLQNSEIKMTAEEATAFLTGIVAETERFSNEKTTPAAMAMASKLMEMGADQQLVATNITVETPLMGAIDGNAPVDATAGNDPTTLDVKHSGDEPEVAEAEPVEAPTGVPESGQVLNTKEKVIEPEADFVPTVEPSAPVAPSAPVESNVPIEPSVPTPEMPVSMPEMIPPEPVPPEESVPPTAAPTTPVLNTPLETPAEVPPSGIIGGSSVMGEGASDFSANTVAPEVGVLAGAGQTIQPEQEFTEELEKPKDYGAMIDAALAEGVPAAPEGPEANSLPEMDYTPQDTTPAPTAEPQPMMQQPVQPVPEPQPVAQQPVDEPVLPMPNNEVVLPPPPAPNVDFSQVMPTDANGIPVLPQVQEGQPQPIPQPAPQPVSQPTPQPVPQPVQNDPSAFRIPGM